MEPQSKFRSVVETLLSVENCTVELKDPWFIEFFKRINYLSSGLLQAAVPPKTDMCPRPGKQAGNERCLSAIAQLAR